MSEEKPKKVIEKATQLVDELYQYRDKYFLVNDLTKCSNSREDDVRKKLDETLKELDLMKNEIEKEDRALFSMLYGKSLNVKNEPDEKAFELLSKAVKLSPKLSEAWNQLGEAYWKKNDLKNALNCFEGTLKQNNRDKVALRSVSMLLRQTGSTPEERFQNIVKSLLKAKEALDADITDGINWYTLGNSYFYMYFLSPNHDSSLLKRCKSAYSRALKDDTARQRPDFLYNYAHILEYEHQFDTCIEYLEQASMYDPSWSEPETRKNCLIKYLIRVSEMLVKRGSIKEKRLQTFIDKLSADNKLPVKVRDKFKLITVNELTDGRNIGKVFVGKVIGSVRDEKLVSNCFCLIDTGRRCVAVCVYNLHSKKEPNIGDTVALLEPNYKLIPVKRDQISVEIPLLKIDSPFAMIVNGRETNDEYVSRPRIDISFRNE